MDPVNVSIPSLNAVVQAVLLRQGMPPADVEALLQAVGQDLSVLFLGQNAQGAQLELPGGQVVTAQGELPFPEGTQLQVRVEAEAGVLKLLTLEARPPAPPAVLAPLLQGEAAALAARLTQATPAPELAPLVQLLRTLGGVPEPSTPSPLPTPAALAAEIGALPAEVQAGLARVLGAPERGPERLAERLLGFATPAPSTPDASGNRNTDGSRILASAAGDLLPRFQVLLQRADVSPDTRSALDGWIRSLLARKAPDNQAPLATAVERGRATEAKAAGEFRLLTPGETAKVEVALKAQKGPAAQVPEAWEAWLKGSTRALADPGVSPREAPFHALQGKDGTAFFEIPLPWAGGKTLQLWVEEDAPENRPADSGETRRVLLSLNLSQLGETRVGLQSAGNSLSVRIWTEHPERVEALHVEIERELAESDRAVDLRILPLQANSEGRIPDLRSLVAGSSLHALG